MRRDNFPSKFSRYQRPGSEISAAYCWTEPSTEVRKPPESKSWRLTTPPDHHNMTCDDML